MLGSVPTSNTLFTTRFGVPDWLPESIRRRLYGRVVAFDIPRPVRLRMRHPEKMRVSEWAEKYRVVTDGAHEGPWRHEYAPHTVKIMDAFGLPWVREVWFCGVEQSGKTNTMLNCIGWAIDCDPGNIFYLMPTEDAAKKITGGKLKPTLQKSPRLSRYLSRKMDDTSLERINLQHGCTIFPAHANSATSMATWAAKHCFGDEVDKYPEMAGKETDPITLIKKRNRTYKGRFKRFFASTPAGKFVYKGMQNCHQVWEYRAKCPDCGELIKMDADHLAIPEGATAETVEQLGADYACTCGSIWDDQKREQAIRHGRWLCVKGAEIARPAKIGFHHRAWECLDIPLSEIGAAWLKGKTGDLAAKVAWANGYEAVDYEEEISDRKEDAILLLRDDRPEGLVPSEPIACITAVADMQKRGFWYKITAWGYGLEQESWTLKNGYVDSWEALRQLFYETEFQDIAGNTHVIGLRGMDSGGGESEQWADLSRTAEAYLFACKNPGMLLFKGQKRMTKPYSVTALDRLPGTNKPLPGSVKLYNLNSKHFKDRLAAKLMVSPTDPGAWHLHKDADVDFARQMCAEGKDDAGYWTCPRGKANHYWDCSYMELALVEIAQVKFWKHKESQAKPQQAQSSASAGASRAPSGGLPSWFKNRR